MKKIPMKFSDTEFGTDEYGYIPAIRGEDPDDADMRYTKHLRDQGIRGRVDTMGNVVVETARRSAMKITETQLRTIIRQERAKLNEASFGTVETTGSTLIDFAEAYASLGGAVRQQVAAVVKAYLAANGDSEDPDLQDVVYQQNPQALRVARDRLGAFSRRLVDLGDEGDAVLAALDIAVDLSALMNEGE